MISNTHDLHDHSTGTGTDLIPVSKVHQAKLAYADILWVSVLMLTVKTVIPLQKAVLLCAVYSQEKSPCSAAGSALSRKTAEGQDHH